MFRFVLRSVLALTVCLLLSACSDDASSPTGDATDDTGSDVPIDGGGDVGPDDVVDDPVPDSLADGGDADDVGDDGGDGGDEVDGDGGADDTGGDAAGDMGDDAGDLGGDTDADGGGDSDTGTDLDADAVDLDAADADVDEPDLVPGCDNGICELFIDEDWYNCPEDCNGFCGDDLCSPIEQLVAAGEEDYCAADCAVTIIFEVDITGEQIALPGGLSNPPPPTDTGVGSIAGNQDQLGNFTPNTILMSDDGTGADTTAGDNFWTLETVFDPGTSLEYKYTVGTPASDWAGTEEYAGGNNRGHTVPSEGLLRVRIRDVFADQPSSPAGRGTLSTVVIEDATCGLDGFCDSPRENADRCPLDCECGDSVCDVYEQTIEFGTEDFCDLDCTCDGSGACDQFNESPLWCTDCTCNENAMCETPTENFETCPSDCSCQDDVCDALEELDVRFICPLDCFCVDDGECTLDEFDAGCQGNCSLCNFDGICDGADEVDNCEQC